MAIDNQFGKGIGLAAGFDLGAQKPLDSRLAVNTIAERDAHVTENRAFEGMIVFVDETKLNYQLVNGEWVELLKAEQDRLDALEAMLAGGEGAEGGALGALQDAIDDVNARLDQNGDVDLRIAQAESDIDKLQGLVGEPAQGEDAATGLHAELEALETRLSETINTNKDTAAGLVNTEKLRAEQQEGLLDQAIKAEADKAREEEGKLQDAIDAINDAEDGILAQAKALDKADRDAQKLIDDAQDDRLAALEAKVDVNAEKTVAEQIQAVQDNLDAFEETQGEKNDALDQKDGELDQAIKDEADRADKAEKKIAQDLADEIANRGTAEQALQKAIDDEIANRGVAEQALQKAIDDEKSRAEGKEGELLQAINKEVQDRKDAIQGVVDDQDVVNNGFEGRIAANEAFVAAQPAIDQEQDRRLKALEDANAEGGAVKEAIDAAQKAADDAQADVDAVEKRLDDEGGLVDRIEANEAFVAAQPAIDAEQDRRLGVIEASIGEGGDLEKRVKANEDAIDVINGEGEGSIKKAVADLVNGAPEALDTLDELAAALRDNKDVLSAIENAFDGKLATLQADVDQNEADCDAAIKAEKEAREAKEAEVAQATAAEQARVNKKISDDIAAAVALRVAEEQRIENECDAAMAQEVIDRNAAIKVETDRAVAKEGELLAAINKEVQDRESAVSGEASARQQADEALDLRLDAIEAKVDVNGKSVADQIADLKSDLEGQMEAAAEAQLQKDNAQDKALTDAIAKEVEDRNAAIKVVSDELAKQKDPAQEGTLAKQIADEIARADAEEKDIRADFAEADQGLQALIDEMKNADKEGSLANLIAALRSDLTAHLTTEPFDGDQHHDDLAQLI